VCSNQSLHFFVNVGAHAHDDVMTPSAACLGPAIRPLAPRAASATTGALALLFTHHRTTLGDTHRRDTTASLAPTGNH
jgi:hypothetical protein